MYFIHMLLSSTSLFGHLCFSFFIIVIEWLSLFRNIKCWVAHHYKPHDPNHRYRSNSLFAPKYCCQHSLLMIKCKKNDEEIIQTWKWVCKTATWSTISYISWRYWVTQSPVFSQWSMMGWKENMITSLFCRVWCWQCDSVNKKKKLHKLHVCFSLQLYYVVDNDRRTTTTQWNSGLFV